MLIERLVVGPLETNCYLLVDDEDPRRLTAIIDPGAEPARIADKVRELNLDPVLMFNTHGHPDHTMGVKYIRDTLYPEYLIHKADTDLQIDDEEIMAWLRDFGGELPPFPDGYLPDGVVLWLAGLPIKVIHTPGHTPGGVCFLVNDVLFTGDTLFAGGVGRTDFPGGSTETLMRSIHERILTLDGSILVLPGHGPDSTIAIEKATNPWLVGSGGYAEP